MEQTEQTAERDLQELIQLAFRSDGHDEDLYKKIGNATQSYHTQRLKEVVGELELSDEEIEEGKSYSKAFMRGRKSENKRILTLLQNHIDDE